MSKNCLFCQILAKEIPAKTCYEDELVLAFEDVSPQAPVHQLIIPKQHISTLNELEESHKPLVGHMVQTAKNLAKEFKLDDGYRVVMNCNEAGGQTVFHIHLHLLGGRSMQWPPG